MNRQCFFGYGLSPSRNLSVAIASNWIEAYKTYVRPNPPSLPQLASPSASESPLNPDEVWVKARSVPRFVLQVLRKPARFRRTIISAGRAPVNGPAGNPAAIV